MPLIHKSSYQPKSYRLFNGQRQTLAPAFFRKILGVRYNRERLELSDGDFVDLDWIFKKRKRLAILTHGLEGNTDRYYIKGAAKFFDQKDWDILAWNCRSCSGEMNRKLRLYNHGEIEDIHEIIQHAMQQNDYEQIVLLGYSMGGSISLKYASVYAQKMIAPLTHVLAYSAPTDLKESVKALLEKGNALYRTMFRDRIERKIRIKAKLFPKKINLDKLKKVKTWWDFDRYFSAPVNGFDDVEEFYHQASAKNFMPQLQIPALLVNAYNDPIIPSTCSPIEMAKHHKYLHLEMPEEGGHVGFMQKNESEFSWMEHRAWEFIHA